MVKPRLLVTRFAPHAQPLVDRLNQLGIFSLAQPLLETLPIKDCRYPFNKEYDFIIAVSTNAVDYTDRSLENIQWPAARYLAVGSATKQLLAQKSGQSVLVPEENYNSEGLLALPCLQDLENRSILILRGLGGRELLRDELLSRGAHVDYHESYQRVAIKLSRSMSVDKWQQQAINGVIISSIELLEQLICLTYPIDEKWLKSLTIYAQSQRILNHASVLGFHKTALLPSISNQEIINYFIEEGRYD